MAYGQTGTGKTYTVGRLGKDDPSERGMMVRALEHILSSMPFETDHVAISYLQVLTPTGDIFCYLTLFISTHQHFSRIYLGFLLCQYYSVL